MGFSRQEYWSGLPFPSPGDLPNPGIEPRSPTLQADALPSEPPGNPTLKLIQCPRICLGVLVSSPLFEDLVPAFQRAHRTNLESAPTESPGTQRMPSNWQLRLSPITE